MLLPEIPLRNDDIAGQPRLGGQQIIKAGIHTTLADVVTDGEQIASGVVQQAEIHVGQFATLDRNPFQRSNPRPGTLGRKGQRSAPSFEPRFPFGRHLGQRRLDQRQGRGLHAGDVPQRGRGVQTPEQLAQAVQRLAGFARLVLFQAVGRRRQGEPRRQVQQVGLMVVARPLVGVGPPREFRVAARRRGQFGGCYRQSRQQGVGGVQRGRRLIEFFELTFDLAQHVGVDQRPAAAASDVQQHAQRIAQAAEHPGRQDQRLAQFLAAAAEHPQVRGQVAAVDHRNITGQQRRERPRVVPVVEMPPVTFHARQRFEGPLRAREKLRGRAVTEIVGRQIGEQRHADVRRTGARRDHQIRILLDVVRRQPMVFRRDELLEIPPRLSRQFFEKAMLMLRQSRRGLANRPTQPPGNQRRSQPGNDPGCREGQQLATGNGDDQQCRGGQ